MNIPIAETENAGVMAYRNEDYATAIRFLQQAVEADNMRWRAKLYLGMAHYKTGDLLAAYWQLTAIAQKCNDQEIRSHAAVVFQAVSNRLTQVLVQTDEVKAVPGDVKSSSLAGADFPT